jgi:argininosuccinate lyase
MLPELVTWSSSFEHDRAFVHEDLLGSAAHVTMLARQKLVDVADAKALRDALLAMHGEANQGTLALPSNEEDVHMAVESELGRRLGAVAGRLHTARSRNDQVALDLRMYVRGQAATTLRQAADLAAYLCDRAKSERDLVMPAYTHRQRAQPISVGFLFAAWASALSRGADLVAYALDSCDRSPIGSGACSGSSLPIDRAITARLLGFHRPTLNALDTVGDRDFTLDWTWAGARVLLALSRLSTDVIDYATNEFGFVTLDGEIAAGSSMMPQKRNPDMFELVRGESARGVGNVVTMLTLVKGLPTGYNRDLQEDRRATLETGPLVQGALRAVSLSLPRVNFVKERCAAGLAEGFTQATDLAEALVRKGIPFREAYKAVGALVRHAVDAKKPLSAIGPAEAKRFHEALDAHALEVLAPLTAVHAKESQGGTGPKALAEQLHVLQAHVDRLRTRADAVPTLQGIAEAIAKEPLEVATSG